MQSPATTDRAQPFPAPAGCADIGAVLQEARDRRGLSLDQISRATKISVTVLRNLELNQIEKLPQRVFLRGFLSAYAREVGLDPDDIVRRYLGQFESAAETADAARQEGSDASPQGGDAEAADNREARRRSTRVRRLATAAALVGVVIGVYTAVRWRTSSATGPGVHSAGPIEMARSPSPASSAIAAAARPETATTGSRETDHRVTTNGDAVHIEIRPQGLCWLSATVDGRRLVYRLMQAGEQQAMDVRDGAVLRVGDPAAFAFSINGVAGRPLGRAGEAVTVHITRLNYREFLPR